MTLRFSDLTSLDTGLRLLFVKVPTFWRVPFWLWRVPFSSGFEINPHFNTMISSWSLGHHMQQITHENTRKLFGKTRGTQFTHESFVIEKGGNACVVNTSRWCGECHDIQTPTLPGNSLVQCFPCMYCIVDSTQATGLRYIFSSHATSNRADLDFLLIWFQFCGSKISWALIQVFKLGAQCRGKSELVLIT